MDRNSEIQAYQEAYKNPNYRMGERRKNSAIEIIDALPRGSLLDIGAGRGELVEKASEMGFVTMGTEVVDYLCGNNIVPGEAHDLPFIANSFDHVTCFDVMEHLIEADLRPALREMYRVASKTCTVSCSERPSIHNGRELHISKRPEREWFKMISECWPGAVRIQDAGASPCYQVTK